MENEIEIWKPVKNFEGLYSVSSLGRVRSEERVIVRANGFKQTIKERILKLTSYNGYYRCNLSNNGVGKLCLVHRLVAEAFIPNPNNLPFINHKDENPSNECVENLEWCDSKYNNNYGTLLQRWSEVRKNGKCSKRVCQYTLDMEFVREWPSCAEVNRECGFDSSTISKVCRGEQKTAYGYKWSYDKDVNKEKGTA